MDLFFILFHFIFLFNLFNWGFKLSAYKFGYEMFLLFFNYNYPITDILQLRNYGDQWTLFSLKRVLKTYKYYS